MCAPVRKKKSRVHCTETENIILCFVLQLCLLKTITPPDIQIIAFILYESDLIQ